MNETQLIHTLRTLKGSPLVPFATVRPVKFLKEYNGESVYKSVSYNVVGLGWSYDKAWNKRSESTFQHSGRIPWWEWLNSPVLMSSKKDPKQLYIRTYMMSNSKPTTVYSIVKGQTVKEFDINTLWDYLLASEKKSLTAEIEKAKSLQLTLDGHFPVMCTTHKIENIAHININGDVYNI